MGDAVPTCLLIADFQIENLAALLGDEDATLSFRAKVAPFGQVMQSLMDENSGIWRKQPSVTVVWTRPERASLTFRQAMDKPGYSRTGLEVDVAGFAEAVRRAAERTDLLLLPSWSLPPYQRGYGPLEFSPGIGLAWAVAFMNLKLAERLEDVPNVHILDAQRWQAEVGKGAVNPKLDYMGKIAFSPELFKLAAEEIRAAWRAQRGQMKKLVLLDLDNTLWGGVVGDVGSEGLRLGGHDAVGEAFVDFQHTLKRLTQRGIVLGIISKNEEDTALDAIDTHPEMVLRRQDFVGWRINWEDKARNIVSLVEELNLGLQSVVFIDDNPVERDRVREALPEVLVPEWPRDPMRYREALERLNVFDTVAISEEDRARTSLYVSERERSSLKKQVTSPDEWLKSLGTVVTVELLSRENAARTVQLLNKTNQMNLTTRRMSEGELREWLGAGERFLWAVRVSDRFGDTGLTGIVSVEFEGQIAQIVDFVLSCRVMGRRVEETMLHVAARHAREAGRKKLRARYLKTPKNRPVLRFFQEKSGFMEGEDGWFEADLEGFAPLPDAIELVLPGRAI